MVKKKKEEEEKKFVVPPVAYEPGKSPGDMPYTPKPPETGYKPAEFEKPESNLPEETKPGTVGPPGYRKPLEIIRDEDGNATGLILPGGSVLPNLTPGQIDMWIKHFEAKGDAAPQEASENAAAQAKAEKQEELSTKAWEIFQKYKGQPLPPDVLQNMTASEIDAYQMLGSGIGGAVPAVAGAAIGGTIGAVVGNVPGAAIGAVAGASAIGSITGGIRNNVKQQISGELSARTIELRRGMQNLRMVISDINGGGNPVTDTALFYENVAYLQEAHAQLYLDTQQDLAKFTGNDGTPELARYKIFFEKTLPLLERELGQAIVNPNPNKILVEPEEVDIE